MGLTVCYKWQTTVFAFQIKHCFIYRITLQCLLISQPLVILCFSYIDYFTLLLGNQICVIPLVWANRKCLITNSLKGYLYTGFNYDFHAFQGSGSDKAQGTHGCQQEADACAAGVFWAPKIYAEEIFELNIENVTLNCVLDCEKKEQKSNVIYCLQCMPSCWHNVR